MKKVTTAIGRYREIHVRASLSLPLRTNVELMAADRSFCYRVAADEDKGGEKDRVAPIVSLSFPIHPSRFSAIFARKGDAARKFATTASIVVAAAAVVTATITAATT